MRERRKETTADPGQEGRVEAPRRLTRAQFDGLPPDVRIALIQQMAPVLLMAAEEEMQREVEELAGTRYGRKEGESGVYRFGSNPGTIKLGGKRYPVRVPRLRSADGEIALRSYELLHNGSRVGQEVLRRALGGSSCRSYEDEQPAAVGGASKSTASREFVAASSTALKTLQDRDLSSLDVVAVFLDGKYFADEIMVLAVGVTIDGSKVFLGFVETGTENARALSDFLRSIRSRGLDVSKGLLVVIDGSKGLRSAVKTVFDKQAVVQRCQWHKRENVVSHMPKKRQQSLRTRLQKAYERPTLEEANEAILELLNELQTANQSAHASLSEGLEETLTLHRLGVFATLGKSFKTTNCIESVNGMVGQICERVDCWKNSSQRQRWFASALLKIEPRLRRVQGHRELSTLRLALRKELGLVP